MAERIRWESKINLGKDDNGIISVQEIVEEIEIDPDTGQETIVETILGKTYFARIHKAKFYADKEKVKLIIMQELKKQILADRNKKIEEVALEEWVKATITSDSFEAFLNL